MPYLTPSAVLPRLVATCLGVLIAMPGFSDDMQAMLDAIRNEEPVIVSGALVPELAGRPLSDLAMFRWNEATSAFEPIPFQADERVNKVFNPGTPAEFSELMYDVSNDEPETLDADDEIVFLFGDAGPQAPPGPWVAGADVHRWEIEVEDSQSGGGDPERYAYLFTGPSLPLSPIDYMSWSGSHSGTIASSVWFAGFADRWVLDEYGVEPPCGTGVDLIDRFKGRAGRDLELESEQDWNFTSTYLGGVVGPVRAIRYVRGAASGVNTIHHDIAYKAFWERVINLRVHAIAGVALYVDLLPGPDIEIFTNRYPGGVAVDGVPDSGMGFFFVPWVVMRSPAGGYAILYEVPPSPHYGAKRFFYRDDVAFDDALDPYYDDDDNSSYGEQGIEIRDLTGSATENILASFRIYPLCSNVGDASLGEELQAHKDNPLAIDATPQLQEMGPVRTLQAQRELTNIVLSWQALPAAQEYHVYKAPSPQAPHESWTLVGETTNTVFVDPGAALDPSGLFYSVVGVLEDDEGEW